MHITFICTGNTCRSPMAEGIARKVIEEKYPDSGITVSSAGLSTYNGAPASQHSIDVCREIGIDISSHRSQRLNPEIAANTDLFAVMTHSHARILRQFGIPENKIALPDEEISDPYGGDEMEYRECREQIAKAVEMLLAGLNSSDEEIVIIPMKAAHIPQIARIEAECFSTPWSEKALAEELNVPSAVFLVAISRGTVAGYMGVHHLGDCAYVCNVAVSQAFRRRGVASRLIEAHIALAREAGMEEISLEVRTSNTAAKALYEKFGFEHLGTRPDFYSQPRENAEIYTLYLTKETYQ